MYYPMMLNLKGKNIVVVGGGNVAYQKLKSLEKMDANIKIVSPIILPSIEEWITQHNAQWVSKEVEPSDIEKADLIFATTNNQEVNQKICEWKKEHQLLLQANHPEEGDFISPAVVRRGKLTIAISTNGANPALAKKLKKEFEEQFDESFADYVQFLEDARKRILEQIQDANIKKKCIKHLLNPIFYELTIERKVVERDELLQKMIRNEK